MSRFGTSQKIIPTIFIALFFTLTSKAQFYSYSQDPAPLKWNQIKTDSFQVIFPQGFEKEANRLANTLHYLYGPVSKTLKHKPRKISVILHNHSSYSNGMVAWAPKLMDLFPVPPQGNYAMDWIEQLAVHELRHVVQIDKLNQGFTRLFYLLYGEQAVGAVTGLMPRWYYEGDAVATETALSSSGRGRKASFEMEMKAIVTSKNKLYSYEKALRGSYQNHIPDPYQLGYPIVAYTRKNYGEDVFAKTERYVARNPYLLFPFPISIKKETGLPLRKLYAATYTDLKKHWDAQIQEVKPYKYTVWNTSKKNSFTNYLFPKYVDESTILAVKSGIDQLTEFVLISKEGRETKIHTPGFYSKDQFSYAAGKFCWDEEIPDIRWGNRMYNCIKIGNLEGKIKTLIHKTRYFSPALSPDGKQIAAVEVTIQNEYYLVILDAETGSVIEKIASPDNKFIQLPSWMRNGNGLVMVATTRKGKEIISLSLPDKNWHNLISLTTNNLSYPTDAGDYVIYVSDNNGTDNLYAVSKNNLSIYKITDEKFGASSPEISANTTNLLFSQYSSQGFSIVFSPITPKKWEKTDTISDKSPALYKSIATQENFNFQDSVIPNREFSIKKYSKAGHLFNIHSWSPFYYNYNSLDEYSSTYPGITLISQDKLGTCLSTLGYAYNDGLSYVKAGFTHKGFYPVIDFAVSYGGKPSFSSVTGVAVPNIPGSGLELSTRVYFPLNFTRSRFIKGLTPYTDWQYNNEFLYNPFRKTFQQGTSKIGLGLEAFVYEKTSLRDLAPRLGTFLSAKIVGSPLEQELLGEIYIIKSNLYLPGIANHHSLQVGGGFQEQNPGIYYYSSSYLAYPRGYTTISSHRIKTLTSTYAMPIAYPDWTPSPFLYVKRLRCNIFADYARVENIKTINNKTGWVKQDLSSIGIDLLIDFHLFRIMFPFQFGLRMVRTSETEAYSSQILLNMDLTSF